MSSIDFARLGRFMFLGAFLLGIYLSRHSAECIKQKVDEFQLGGVVDDGSSSPIVDDQGVVKKGTKGDYDENFRKGSGFFGYLADETKVCIEESSFSDPKWAYLGFWGLVALGGVSSVLGRLITPDWKKGVKQRAQKEQDAAKEREQALQEQRKAQARSAQREIKPIDVGDLGFGGGASAPEEPPKGRKAAKGGGGEDMSSLLMDNSGDVSRSSTPARGRGPSPKPRSEEDDDLLHTPRKAGISEEKRRELAALGLGTDDDPLPMGGSGLELAERDEPKKGAAAGGKKPPVLDDGPPKKRPKPPARPDGLPFSGDEEGPASQDEAEERRLARAKGPLSIDASARRNAAGQSNGQRARLPSISAMAAYDSPDSFDGEDPLLDEAPRSLSSRAARGSAAKGSTPPQGVSRRSVSVAVDRRKLWIPQGREADALLFVAPDGQGFQDPTAGENEARPLDGLAAALRAAEAQVAKGASVQLRLSPGVYREQVSLPPGVSLINNAIPKGRSGEELRHWLTAEAEGDDPIQVVLALPDGAPEDAFTVELVGAHHALLAGLHIVGRASLTDDPDALSAGVRVEGCQEATLYLCHIVGHRTHQDGGALQVKASGDADKNARVLVQDCLLDDNATSGRGGAVYVEDAAAIFKGCALQSNESGTAGGAAFLGKNRLPTVFDRCVFVANEAALAEALPRASRGGWSGEDGHGGAIFVRDGEVQLTSCDFTENQAQGAGGAIFAAASVLLIEGDPEGAEPRGRFVGNSSLRGGAILLSGPGKDNSGGSCAMRAQDIEFIGNEAIESGGALAGFRLARIELRRCTLQQNKVSAEFGEGGAIHANLGSKLKMGETTLARNEAPFRGGALSVCNSSARLHDGCRIADNRVLEGDCGGVAFYTMASTYLDELRETGNLEDPLVFALGDCAIEGNSARRGVGGLFVGNFVREVTSHIAFTLLHPGRITGNQVLKEDGTLDRFDSAGKHRPMNLLVAWKGAIQGDDGRIPEGKRILR